MRQVAITVPPEEATRVAREADRLSATPFAEIEAERDGKPVRLMIFEIPNGEVEALLGALEDISELRASFAPQGIIALRPPADEPEDQMTDIQPRSPLEIFLGGLQSIGSWPSFLGYAAVGGVIVWIGLYIESVFLLVAAMLIAPFASPAMTTALATARGDRHLLARSILRYVAALSTTIAVAFGLSIAFGQDIATPLMIETSMRSTVSLLLPLAAGVAGALNLAQSERSSLVSGAATGMLVAAALAPPAGLVGMGLAIGEMDIVISSLWALAIQIVGINLAGFVVFRMYGMTTRGARYPRGKSILSYLSIAASLAILAGLLLLQFAQIPQYQQSSVAQRISAAVQQDIEAIEDVQLVGVQSHFTRTRHQGENPVWVSVRVQATMSEAREERLARQLSEDIEREFGVVALVDLDAVY